MAGSESTEDELGACVSRVVVVGMVSLVESSHPSAEKNGADSRENNMARTK